MKGELINLIIWWLNLCQKPSQFVLEATDGDVRISALVVPKITAPIRNYAISDVHNIAHL